MSSRPSPLKSPVPATCQRSAAWCQRIGGIVGEAAVGLAEPVGHPAVVVAPQDVVAAVAVEVADAGHLPAGRNAWCSALAALPAKPPLAWPASWSSAPSSWRHRMSSRPSPLKSPVPATCQLVGTSVRDWPHCRRSRRWPGPASRSSAPSSWRHNMSLRPSPLKSLRASGLTTRQLDPAASRRDATSCAAQSRVRVSDPPV